MSAADNIIVRQKTGDTSHAISQISKITFPTDGSGVVFNYTDGTSQTFARSQFVSLRFNGNLVGAELIEKGHQSAIIYSPATETIMLLGADDVIYVYSSCGALVAEGNAPTLPVAHLAEGTYIVKSGSLTSKFVKR